MASSCGVLISVVGEFNTLPLPLLQWRIDHAASVGRETMTGSVASMVASTGRLSWVGDADGVLPRFDGYSVWMEHHFEEHIRLDKEVGISAWVALESFPVSPASVIEWGDQASGVRLAVDRLGFVLMSVVQDGITRECQSQRPISPGRWIHLAGTLALDGTLQVFCDGSRAGALKGGAKAGQLEPIRDVYVGRGAKEETVAKIFRTNVLNGLIREVRVYRSSFSDLDIQSLSRQFERRPASLGADASWFRADVQRPLYHAMPPRAWTNEPHGLVHWRGIYHLFYQKNANGPYWGHICWGHMTSPDLMHWTEHAPALIPQPGPDSEGCWSGSVVVAHDKLVVFYTGGDGHRASICSASTGDGITFEKSAGNPVIKAPPHVTGIREFRDPFVWRQGAEYRMIVGSGIEGQGGTALLYRSADLIGWTYIKPLFIGDKSNSGTFWEMPIFVPLGDHHVLIVCEVPGRASYWVGTWGEDNFEPYSSAPQRLDLFNHFLSPTPYVDEKGRLITIGIVPETRASIEQWQAGWAHLYGVPRLLTIDGERRLQQQPLPEFEARFSPFFTQDQEEPVGAAWTVLESEGACVLVRMRVHRRSSESITIAVRRSPDRQEETLIQYEWKAALLTLDRTRSTLDPHTARNAQQTSYSPPVPDHIEVTIFLDQSVLEVFLDGRACFTSRLYPILPESVGIALCSEGGDAAVSLLTMSGLKDDLASR